MCWRYLFCCFVEGDEDAIPLNPSSAEHHHAPQGFHSVSITFYSAKSGSLIVPTPPTSPMGDHQDQAGP